MNKGLEQFNKLKTWYVLKMVEGNELLLRDNEKEMLYTIEKELKEYEQYKAIEQELGIDLVTLFKALKNGACFKRYDKNGNVEIKRVSPENISLRKSGGEWVFDIKLKNFSTGYIVCENYGKTWALTREELEK